MPTTILLQSFSDSSKSLSPNFRYFFKNNCHRVQLMHWRFPYVHICRAQWPSRNHSSWSKLTLSERSSTAICPQLEVGLHGFLPVPGWNSGWLDLAQILGWELEVPWVNECDGPVMSRTHCLAAIPLEPLFRTVLSPPPWQCSLVWEEEGVMLMFT